MAATRYEVLYRYYNIDMKMPITNVVNEEWVSCFNNDNSKFSFIWKPYMAVGGI